MELGGAPQLDGQLTTALESARQERLQSLGARAGELGEDRAGLERAAKEFEAVFLNQLMKAMRKTVPENELFNGGGPVKFYQQMYDAEIAKSMTGEHGGLGVADLIVRQFETSVAGKRSDSVKPELSPEPVFHGTAPVLGPPSPGVMERYRQMSVVGEATAKLARLRMAAAQQGTAVADTLDRFSREIMDAAGETGLEPALILSVIMEESAGDPGAESHRGALGLMQLMPQTAAEVGVQDPRQPAANLRGGARYLAQMLERYDDRLDLALAAYNAGPGAVDAAKQSVPDFPETQRYVGRVTQRLESLLSGTKMANDRP